MVKAYTNLNRQTPQSMPIPGREKDMAQNNAGGYAFAGGKEGLDWLRFRRFLIIGSEGGTYYQKEAVLTRENASSVLACVKQDYKKAIDTIVYVSDHGLAPKNDPALFALALATTTGDEVITRYAMGALPSVARIGTHILHFTSYLDGMRSWGRAVRRGVGLWYGEKLVGPLGYQLGKYQQRDGWSHRDVLRSCHYRFSHNDPAHDNLIKWAVGKPYSTELLTGLPMALEEMSHATSLDEVVSIMLKYRAPMEIVPTEYKNKREVWEAALPNLGMEAIVRNLGNMARYGVTDSPQMVNYLADRITNKEALAKSRIHPFKLLIANRQYGSGRSNFGDHDWPVNKYLLAATEQAMYDSFQFVEPTGKRIYLALDVSGSMAYRMDIGISCREATAIMAMVNFRVEENSLIRGFSHEMVDVPLLKTHNLERVCRTINDIPMGGTDCALPMIDAYTRQEKVDAFVIYTDNETWHGDIHPAQALKQYRQRLNPDAKLIVVGMTSTGFTIADPKDPFQMDVVGLSADTPAAISAFIKTPTDLPLLSEPEKATVQEEAE